jgi:hypothetical protein
LLVIFLIALEKIFLLLELFAKCPDRVAFKRIEC